VSEHLADGTTRLTALVDTDPWGLSSGSCYTIPRAALQRALPGILLHLQPGDRRIWSLMTKNVTVASLTIKSLGERRVQITLDFTSNNVDMLAGLTEPGEPT
jgi:hypothetical protein